MTIEIWSIYVATVFALMSTPGPSQLLMLSNSAKHGISRSLATAVGDLSANTLQMLAAGLGLAAILTASGHALLVIKWLGVCYLIWLSVRMICKASPQRAAEHFERKVPSLKTLWLQGFLTSAANPKAIVFFAALFPQFIQEDHAFWPQFLILSATYILLDGSFLSVYGMTAGWMGARFKGPTKVWIERVGGGFIILAAILLSFRTLKVH